MAKTRIKTTPTRMQKEAQTASSAVNSSNTRIVTEHVLKKRIYALNNNSMLTKEAIPIQSTIIVQPPKRTTSISSATSTISHTSDGNSSTESPPPTSSCSSNTPTNCNGPTMDELTENAIKTLNAGLLAKTNALALKNRKVYMITEKCDNTNQGASNNGTVGAGNGIAPGTMGGTQKRKMYLIMEEKGTADYSAGHAEKLLKSEGNNGTKKLTLFTDTSDGQLPQKIEQILPEILNCIQAKGAAAAAANGGGIMTTSNIMTKPCFVSQDMNCKSLHQVGEKANLNLKTESDNNERLPLTLPPKKNRTKIITTQIIPVPQQYQHLDATPTPTTLHPAANGSAVDTTRERASVTHVFSANGSSQYAKLEKSSSATPVIVSANSLMSTAASAIAGNGTSKENGGKTLIGKSNQLHKNINLSTDFLFLMKILPKLESVAEPHKNYVRTCIEDIINQYALDQ